MSERHERTVLITRPQPDANIFADACRREGLVPLVEPLLSVSILSSPINLSTVSALAFTSANGVRAFCKSSEERSLPVFAVGAATAGMARTNGFKTIYEAQGDLESLAVMIDTQKMIINNGAVLHVAGQQRAGDLIAELSTRGIKAQRAVLYDIIEAETLPDPVFYALKSGRLDWATFFSPRSARLFRSLVNQAGLMDHLASVRAAFLSEAVAGVFEPGCWASSVVASERTAAGILLLIQDAA